MASGGTPSTNRVFLFRLQTLIVDGGTLVLRKMFDQRLPNVALNVFLSNEKTSINRLRGQKTITAQQYDLLFPQSGQLPNSSDFDITLIICLLRNLKSLGLNGKYKWNATPQPADTSVEADLCRLKGFRNEVAHISSTYGIQPVLFQTKWTEIEQVLLRLNSALLNPDPALKQIIDGYKNDPLDPVAEQRLQKEIENWRIFERGLETDILMVKKDMKKDMKEINESFQDMNVEVTEIGKDVTKVSEEVKEVGKDVTKVSEEVKEVGKDVTKVSEEVKEVGKDVTKVSEEVKEVGKDVTKVSEEVKEVGKDVTKVSEEVKEVGKDVTKVSEEVKEVGKDVTKVSEEVKEVGHNVIKVSEEVIEVAKDVSKVKESVTEVREVREDVKELKQHVDVLKKGFSKLETDAKGDAVSDSRGQKKPGILKRVKNFFSSRKSRHTKEPLSAQVKTPIREEDEAYLKMKTDLQDNLISFYRRQHRTIPLSPVIEEDSPLLKFYVMPDIKSLNVKRTGDGVKEEKTPVKPFRNVFYNENKICRNIYLTADAGLGKTAFSKRLALTWCHAKNPNTEEGQFFSQEEIKAMHEFRFVFLLLLRNSSSECDIVDLIWTQVVSQLPPRYTRDKLEDILFKERSLVILDGLDEWCHLSDSCKEKMSPIPHRKDWEHTAVLTTTRPWKLSVSGLHSSQIDQKLEIMGLNQESAKALKTSVISDLCADKTVYEVQQDVEKFTRSLKEKQISDLETIPLLLMYLLFCGATK